MNNGQHPSEAPDSVLGGTGNEKLPPPPKVPQRAADYYHDLSETEHARALRDVSYRNLNYEFLSKAFSGYPFSKELAKIVLPIFLIFRSIKLLLQDPHNQYEGCLILLRSLLDLLKYLAYVADRFPFSDNNYLFPEDNDRNREEGFKLLKPYLQDDQMGRLWGELCDVTHMNESIRESSIVTIASPTTNFVLDFPKDKWIYGEFRKVQNRFHLLGGTLPGLLTNDLCNKLSGLPPEEVAKIRMSRNP